MFGEKNHAFFQDRKSLVFHEIVRIPPHLIQNKPEQNQNLVLLILLDESLQVFSECLDPGLFDVGLEVDVAHFFADSV